jgi:hypothetical protein
MTATRFAWILIGASVLSGLVAVWALLSLPVLRDVATYVLCASALAAAIGLIIYTGAQVIRADRE